jgi:hypothetical protein
MKTGLRNLWRIGAAICSLPLLYVLVYVILSFTGRYGPVSDASLAHLNVSSYWMPYGTYDPHVPVDDWTAAEPGGGNKWRMKLLLFYWPLCEFDNRYFHNRHDIYITGCPGADQRWTYTTNTASILVSHR